MCLPAVSLEESLRWDFVAKTKNAVLETAQLKKDGEAIASKVNGMLSFGKHDNLKFAEKSK